MSNQWTFGMKLGLTVGFSEIVLLTIGLIGYLSTQRLIENDRRVSHTHQVRRDLSELLSELKDAETGQRGFLITGIESFLTPYNGAVEQISTS